MKEHVRKLIQMAKVNGINISCITIDNASFNQLLSESESLAVYKDHVYFESVHIERGPR